MDHESTLATEQATPNTRHSPWIGMVLILVIPLLVAAWSFALRQESGPFWLGHNSDPAYAYLLNGLALSQVQSTVHADHPGATLHWFTAILLYPIDLLVGDGDLSRDVLTHPEVFLAWLHGGLIGLLVVLLLVAGVLVLRWTGDLMAAVLFQSGVLWSSISRASLAEMSPEPLLLILATALAVLVCNQVSGSERGVQREPAWQYGLLVGLGLALKVNFLPLALVPLFMLSSVRKLMVFIGVSSLTIILLLANPLANTRGFLSFLVNNLLVREGYNRPLEEGRSAFGAMVDGVRFLISEIGASAWPVILLITGFAVLGLLQVCRSKPVSFAALGRPMTRVWLGILAALAFQVFLSVNGPYGKSHYLVPALGLTGLMACLSWSWLVRLLRESVLPSDRVRTISGAVFLIALGGAVAAAPVQLKKANEEAMAWTEATRFRESNGMTDVRTLFHYRASGRAFALHFGNQWAGNLFSNQLRQIHPGFLYFNIWDRTFEIAFGYPTNSPEGLFDEPIVVQGMKGPQIGAFVSGLGSDAVRLENRFEGSREHVLVIRPSPDK